MQICEIPWYHWNKVQFLARKAYDIYKLLKYKDNFTVSSYPVIGFYNISSLNLTSKCHIVHLKVQREQLHIHCYNFEV